MKFKAHGPCYFTGLWRTPLKGLRHRLVGEPPLGSYHRHLQKGPLGGQGDLVDAGSGEGALLKLAAEGECGK